MSATVPVRWSKEPEKTAWMLEHAGGRPIADVRRDFEERFGHPLTQAQVSLFRAGHDMARRRGNRTAHHKLVPIGTERVCKGYVLVKVAELSSRPQSKDNWQYKHIIEWERTRGLRLPEGWMVLFCDGDNRNFEPSNLKAVPRSLIGVLNTGPRWSDRATLEAAIALASVKRGAAMAASAPRRCRVCGREFTPDNRCGVRLPRTQSTCRECLDKGLRGAKDYGRAVCPECGRVFEKHCPVHRFCSGECSYENRKRRRADG